MVVLSKLRRFFQTITIFVVQSSNNPKSLQKLISHFHTATARYINKRHETPGRKVWHQYWDLRITFHNSYLARLNYVTQNPVKHGLVKKANLYRWCSANWFEQRADPAYFKVVTGFKTDSVQVIDDF